MQTILRYCLVLFFLLPSIALAAPPDPTDQLRPFINRIIEQLKQPEFRQQSIEAQTKHIVGLVSEHFDFQEMSKRVMGRQWQNLSAAQQEQFVGLFTELLQYIYIGQVDEYLDSSVEFGEQRIRGDRAEVRSIFVGPQKSIPVSYILILRGDTWMAYDIVVENVSLIRNYMEQIQSVMHREKFPGLVKMLENKIEEMKEAARK